MTKMQKGILAGCLFLLIILAPIIISKILSFTLISNYRSSSSTSVFHGFVSAMKNNNEELAKSVVSPENFPRIDSWINEHEVFVYSPVWIFTNSDPFEYVTGGGSGLCILKEDKCYWGLSQEYYCYNKLLYRIEFDEVTLKKFGSDWLIVDWGEITEIRHDPKTYCKSN